MADFVDYTNVTELEKFTMRLGILMKAIENEILTEGEFSRKLKNLM